MHEPRKLTKDQLVTLVRMVLRDSPVFNEATESFTFSDEEILVAASMAIGDWNSTPPLICSMDLNAEVFYAPNWLIDMTALRCMRTLINQNIANHIAYSDGGISHEEWDKAPMYQAVIDRMMPELEQKKKEMKVAMNVSRFAGYILSSEFTTWTYSTLAPSITFGGTTAASAPKTPAPPPRETFKLAISKDDWLPSKDGGYSLVVTHGLKGDVDARLTDPATGEDVRRHVGATYGTDGKLTLTVPQDGRQDVSVVVYKL